MFQKKTNRSTFAAQVTLNGKLVFGRVFATAEEAAHARDDYINTKLPGMGYKLNFPLTTENLPNQ